MSKHTCGPWVKYDSAYPQFFVTAAGKDICKTLTDDISLLEAEANSNLIAAAPDLLEALEAINDQLDRDGYMGTTYGPLRHAAISAISKARGAK